MIESYNVIPATMLTQLGQVNIYLTCYLSPNLVYLNSCWPDFAYPYALC